MSDGLEGLKELKEKILELIKDSPMTVQELCRVLSHKDDFDIATALLELDIENRVGLAGWKTAYQGDGSPVYLGLYRAVPEIHRNQDSA